MLYQIQKTRTGEIRAFQHDSYSNIDVPLSKKQVLDAIQTLTEYLKNDDIDVYHDVVYSLCHLRHNNVRYESVDSNQKYFDRTYGEKMNELPLYVKDTLKEMHEVKEEAKRNDYMEDGYFRYRENRESKEKREAVKLEFNLPTKYPKAGYVYFIEEDKTNTVKIGYTKNIEQRLKAFVSLPFELKPLCFIQTNDACELETWFHNHFADKRVNGEWFSLSVSDRQFVTSGEFKKNTSWYEHLNWKIDKESPYYKEVVNK